MAAQVIANSIVLGLTLALMAIGLTLIYGILLVVNFAHGEFYMLGAVFLYYVTSSTGLGYWVSAVIAIVAVGVLGWVLEVLVFRRFHGDLIGGCIAAIALTIGIQSITWEVWGPRTRAVAAPVHGTIRDLRRRRLQRAPADRHRLAGHHPRPRLVHQVREAAARRCEPCRRTAKRPASRASRP